MRIASRLSLLALCACARDEPPAAAAHPTYLHLSDVHLDLTGESKNTGPALWARTKAKLAAIVNGPDAPTFVLFTGDLPAYYDCRTSDCGIEPSQLPAHEANVRAVLSDLHELVAESGVPLLYVPGNNDSLAGDYFSFTDRAGRTPLSLVPREPFPAVNASRADGAAPCLVSAPHPSLGFYSARPVEGLRVVAMNTVILGREYHAVDGDSPLDAGDAQLEWLADQLADARGAEKVLIAMHIPPGTDADAMDRGHPETWMWSRRAAGALAESWLDRFLDLMATFEETVIGVAYGHTHMDELRRLHDRAGRVTEVAVSAPGITTIHGNNPGFKLVSYDLDTKELLDFVTHYTPPGATEWGAEQYSFAEVFDCPGGSILGCLKSPRFRETSAVDRAMDVIYTVKNGPSPYENRWGIEVVFGQ